MGCGSSVVQNVNTVSTMARKPREEKVEEDGADIVSTQQKREEEQKRENERAESEAREKQKAQEAEKEKERVREAERQKEIDQAKQKEAEKQKEAKEREKEKEGEKEREGERPAHPHEHPLGRADKPPYPIGSYNCDLCNRLCSGEVYHCTTCNYDNCPECYAELTSPGFTLPPKRPKAPDPFATPRYSHPHPHTLERQEISGYPGGAYDCDNCGTTQRGPVYHCEPCKYDNCPACFLSLSNQSDPAPPPLAPPPVSSPPSHPHPHPLDRLEKPSYASGKFRCDICKTTSTGLSYHCTPCKYDNCPSCFEKLSNGVDPSTIPKVQPTPQQQNGNTQNVGQQQQVEDGDSFVVKGGPKPPNFSNLTEITNKAKEQVAQIVADCKAKGNKYVDNEFAPTTVSLWRDPFFPPPETEILYPKNWRRLTAMVPVGQTPVLWGESGPTPGDILQGGIGTCFLLSALGVLAGARPNSIKDLFVAYDIEVGVYALRFWKDGRWVYVVIDDYVPTTLTTQTKRVVPAYAYCSSDNMFWVPLVEKAYAKLHQCYENIDGGFSNCAMMDLTGGYSMGIMLHDPLSSPVFSVNKYKSPDTVYYLGFVNGILTGGGWRGAYNEFTFEGTYTIEGDVEFTQFPVKSRMGDPIQYLVNYKGKIDMKSKSISGTCIQDRSKGLQNNSGITYTVSGGAPKEIPFKWDLDVFDKTQKPDVFDGLHAAMRFNLTGGNVLMSCSAHPPNAAVEEHTPEGLLLKHEYAILDVIDLPNKNNNNESGPQLVMLKNPHGRGSEEWKGDWSDNSALWDAYPEEKKKYVKTDTESDGIFCMAFKDWRAQYTHLNMNRLFENKGWNEQTFQGMITPESSGLSNNKAKTKYVFQLPSPTRMVISISQPDNKRFDNTEFYSFGIGLRVVMALKVGSGIIEEPVFDRDNVLVVAEVAPVHARQVSVEIYLDSITKEYESYFGPGKYFIMPLTDEEGYLPYVLNVFSYETKPSFEVMKPTYPPTEPLDTDYRGDWRPHWFYEILPHYEGVDDDDEEEEETGDEASKGRNEIARAKGRDEIARAKGRDEIARAKGRNEIARAKGRNEVARAKGRAEIARSKGRYELARAKGRTEIARAKGRAELARAKGRAEMMRAKGRNEIGRAKGANTEHRQAGKANTLKKEGVAEPEGVQEINDPIQDALEQQFKSDYSL